MLIDLGTAYALIGDTPVKYGITLIPLRPSSGDKMYEMPAAYSFIPQSQQTAGEQGTLYVRVRHDVIVAPPSVADPIHQLVVRFAISQLRVDPTSREVDFDQKALQTVRDEGILGGESCGRTMLNYCYRINSVYPMEPLAVFDILDNYNADIHELNQWLRSYEEAGYLKKARGFKEYVRIGTRTSGYYINPAKVRDVKRELEVDTTPVTIDLSPYKHFKVIEIEADRLNGDFAFYMTEFRGESLDVYENCIKQFCNNELGLEVFISKEDRLPSQIDDKVISHIHKCRFVIADITTRNPNVMYEIGFAHAIGKDVVIICNESGRAREIFDIRNIDTDYFSDRDQLCQMLRTRVQALRRQK
jgi:hypothetical protein